MPKGRRHVVVAKLTVKPVPTVALNKENLPFIALKSKKALPANAAALNFNSNSVLKVSAL